VDPKNLRQQKRLKRRFLEINQQVELLFHVLVVNLASMYEIHDDLKKLNDNRINKLCTQLKICWDVLERNKNLINDWRNNVTAHGHIFGDKGFRGPVDIAKSMAKAQRTIFLATKCACMYASGILNNLVLEATKANKIILKKFSTTEHFDVNDYFKQLRIAKNIQRIVKRKLVLSHLNDDIIFARSES
jgi:hypothetical protein